MGRRRTLAGLGVFSVLGALGTCPDPPTRHATIPLVVYVIRKGANSSVEGHIDQATIEATVARTNHYYCGSQTVDRIFDDELSEIATNEATIDNCGNKCGTHCGSDGVYADTLASLCTARCTELGNCGTLESCELSNCNCGDDYCGNWGDPTASYLPLQGPRSDSAIRLALESVQYIDNADWFDHCCCTNKGGIDYTPTQNAIFDTVVDKETARSKLHVVTCSMGSTAGQSLILGSGSCEGGVGIMLDHVTGLTDSTLAHELGHHLGLDHTFARNCKDGGDECDQCNLTTANGDNIDDTPQQGTKGTCTFAKDSCPDLPGLDPIDNIMSYSGCANVRFTPNQIERMWGRIEAFLPETITPCVATAPAILQCNPNLPSGYTRGYNYTCLGWEPACQPPVDPEPLPVLSCPSKMQPTSDQWTCWYHGADAGGWRSDGETTTGGTKFCPVGTQARHRYDGHCMGGWCGDFSESECCQRTCWASGWRESGDASGTHQCPATAEARGSTDRHDCGERCGESSECCTPRCGLSGFTDQSACPAETQFMGGSELCWSSEARSTGMCSESECCKKTCWVTGWRESGDASGTHQCPATAEARGSTDGHDCGERCGESSECCTPRCGLSGFTDQSACSAGAEFKGEWNMCYSSEARSTGVCLQSDCCRQTCSGAGYTDSGDTGSSDGDVLTNQCSVGMTYRPTEDWYECKTTDCSDAECCGVPSTGSGTCWDAGFRDSTLVLISTANGQGIWRQELPTYQAASTSCPAGFAVAATEVECRAAAEALGLGGNEFEVGEYPGGGAKCSAQDWASGGNVLWNPVGDDTVGEQVPLRCYHTHAHTLPPTPLLCIATFSSTPLPLLGRTASSAWRAVAVHPLRAQSAVLQRVSPSAP